MNTHPSEVDKFSQISSQWWDLKGPFKPLHEINPIRLKFILDRLPNSSVKNQRILDIGCGGGILTESLAKAGGRLTGMDASAEAIAAASQHAKEKGLIIDYFQTTAEQFISPDPYDIVTCMELLEHVPDPASVIHSCARLVKPEGLVFFSTLNRNLKSFLFAIVGAEYILGLIPKGTHDYAKFIKPSELQKMALQADLPVISIKGMSYHPLLQTYRLSSDVDVNYIICCQKTTV